MASLSPVLSTDAWTQRLRSELRGAVGRDLDMGSLETIIEERLPDLLGPILQEAVALRAEREERERFVCPDCRTPLRGRRRDRPRTIRSRFGPIGLRRRQGFCPACGTNHHPADTALGLHAKSPASPRFAELCSLLVLHAPAGRVGGDARRLCGIRPSPAGLHREARRQGERATGVRDRLCAMAADPEGRRRLRAMAAPAPAGFTLIIEIDAWNIRERDGWGRTAELRAAGEEPPRWHWVYTATVFRLDHRGATASGRPIVSERG